MKKRLIFVIIVAIFFSSAALADPSPASFLYGTWARIVEYSDMELCVDMFHIFPDHRVYMITSWVNGANVDTSPNEVNSWSFEDGKLYLFINGGYFTFIPTDDYTLKTDEQSPVLYKKIYPRRDL